MNEPRKDGEFENISSLHLSRLLPLGMSKERRPIDELLDRLRASDGESWLAGQLEVQVASTGRTARETLLDENSGLDDLKEIKNRGNQGLKSSIERDRLLGSMALYFLAIAAALARHDALISSQPRDKLAPVLSDLASSLPTPWKEFVERAAN